VEVVLWHAVFELIPPAPFSWEERRGSRNSINGLAEEIAQGSGFNRTGNHRHTSGIGSELIEQFVLRAAADNVYDFNRCPR